MTIGVSVSRYEFPAGILQANGRVRTDSRDSGSHESAWELAKARVRARASLALPSVMEELA